MDEVVGGYTASDWATSILRLDPTGQPKDAKVGSGVVPTEQYKTAYRDPLSAPADQRTTTTLVLTVMVVSTA